MLGDDLARLAVEYTRERVKPFASSDFGNFVRHDLVVEARKTVPFRFSDIIVKASVGAGNWASVPWLAFFDRLVTDTATQGVYVVYLVNAQRQTVTLSLNQGATAVLNEFGGPTGREVLRRRADDIKNRVKEYSRNFSANPIEMSSGQELPLAYEAGHAFGQTYSILELSNERRISSDLEEMLTLYEILVDRGGLIPVDLMTEMSGTTEITETRRSVLSVRIERSANVRREVLARRGVKCEGCGLEPLRDYSYQGRPENLPLDVHHLVPLYQLAEGESRRYKIPDDFLVLCPTCHRIIHMQPDAADLEKLRSDIRFKHAREVRDLGP